MIGDRARADDGPRRRGGRPRDPEIEPRALAAAKAIIGRGGVRACSMSDVAQAAGCGKPTLYLRWPDVASLVGDALARWPAPAPLAGAGPLEDALVEALRRDHQDLVLCADGAFLRAVVCECPWSPGLRAILDAVVLAPRRAALLSILGAHARPRPDPDGLPGPAQVAAMLEALTIAAVMATDDGRRNRDPAPLVRAVCRGIAA